MPGSASDSSPAPRRLAILGAGPVGLDAALAGLQAGFDVTLFEAGSRPGANVRSWSHVRMFSPWEMNVSDRMRQALERAGTPLQDRERRPPTGEEFAERVLDPLFTHGALAERLRLGTRVVAVGRTGTLKHEEIANERRAARPFRILVRDAAGVERVEEAEVVIDCTGKSGPPNALGDGGIPAPGEAQVSDRIDRNLPDIEGDPTPWEGRTVLVAGSGHSAQTAVRALAALGGTGTRIVWVLRRARPDWGSPADDPLRERGALAATSEAFLHDASGPVRAVPGSVVEALDPAGARIRVRLRLLDGTVEEVVVDRILSLTGRIGDDSLYRQLQVHECYAFAAPMKLSAALLGAAGGSDCTEQTSHGVDTLRNPEPNFFILGDKSYGRNNTFLLRIGWQQVDEVFEALAGAS